MSGEAAPVAHLVEAFSDTTETFLYEGLVALEAVGCPGLVLTYARRNVAARPYPRLLQLARRPRRVGVLERGELAGALPPGARFWPLRRELTRVLRRLRPRAVHAHFGPMGALAAPVAARLGLPLYVSFYGYDVGEVDPRLYEALWPNLRRGFALSEKMRAALIQLGCPPERLSVIRLGRRLEPFPWRERVTPLRRFISVGRLTEKKGHDLALGALARLAPAHPELRLEIYGCGAEQRSLAEQIERLGLADRAALRGEVAADAVPGLLSQADGFLLASRTSRSGDQEGTPTAILEAQASGLLVVSTRHAGIPEIVPSRNHDLLAEEGDLHSLSEVWRRALELGQDEVRARTRAARALVEAQHDVLGEARKVAGHYPPPRPCR